MTGEGGARPGALFLGHVLDPGSGERTGEDVLYDARDLTTHGVIVGMTGSGKTGLGVVLIEEALLSGVPALVLDPKGDMTNLRLCFPDLAGRDFQPWVNPGDARRKELDVPAYADETARTWRDGLASSGVPPERLAELCARTVPTIYTPGSTAGVPLNIVGSLRAPDLDWAQEAETLRDEIEGFVTGLLGLTGIQADPITSREHILLANLIEHAWSHGEDLDLPTLIAQVQRPPLRKLGVFELDAFFPEKDRTALAMRLNGLVASPTFAAWMEGADLDIGALLAPADGKTPAAILYLAHLSDEERQFIVTLVLSKVVTWFRGLPGTTDLRALVYMDEVFGYAPPTANPPSKKPILTILKQARAFGVGMVLSTQNPVDLDYKAMGNAGTWMVGRLQTERDKARVVEGLASARGDVDVPALDTAIGGLGKRQFLLQSAHVKQPILFGSRWAMSYLRGPMTREQVSSLTPARPPTAPVEGTVPVALRPAETSEAAPDESPVAPKVAAGIPVRYLHPGAPWARELGSDPRGTRLEAALAARVRMRFDDVAAAVEHDEEWEAIAFPLAESFDAAAVVAVDYEARDFDDAAPQGAVYALPRPPLEKSSYFTAAERALRDRLYRERTVEVFRNRSLKLYSRVGEAREAFEARCVESADSEADREAAKLRDRFETKLKRAQEKLARAEQRLAQAETDVETRKRHELLSGAGDLLSALLTGRSRTKGIVRSISKGSSRRSLTERAGQRAETAEAQVEAYAEDIEALEAEVAEALQAIHDEWQDKAAEVETVEIGLEKNDITVTELAVVWVPVARGTAPGAGRPA